MAGDGSWRPVGELFFTGTVLVAAILLGYLLGSWLDGKLNSAPWFLVFGVLLGSLAGFLNLWHSVKKLT